MNKSSLSIDDREAFEERAAIMEFEGGLTRAESERRAWEWIRGVIETRKGKR